MRLRHLCAALVAVLLAGPLAAQTRFGDAPTLSGPFQRLAEAARGGDDGEQFTGVLTGAKEVPAAATQARGAAVASFNRATRELSVDVIVQDLEGSYLFSHVHEGAAGTNGPVILPATDDGRVIDGYREILIEGTLTEAQVASLDAGNLYVNVHSSLFPGGEIRAQLGRTLTLTEARAAGVGQVVTVAGVVQRARGAFTYVTDLERGLTVRQTSGAWRDAITSGELVGGRYVRFTGTLSEFRGLLQVNQANATTNDLASFEIGPIANENVNLVGLINSFPVFSELDLADIAARGEEFEGQLVVVRNVTLAGGAGGMFMAGSNVAATDASTPANPVVVRVPSANDTDIDGTPIPTTPVNILAIVGQFTTTTPDIGYQLLVIDAGDVDPKASVQIVHNAPDPALNPVDIATDGVVAFDNVAFRTATPTVQLAAFNLINLAVLDPATGAALYEAPGLLVGDDGRTGPTILAAQGVGDPAQFAANPDGVPTEFDLYTYPAARLRAGLVGVRAVHGAPDAPTVDVRVGAAVLADDLQFTDFSGFAAAAGPVRLDVTTADGSAIAAQFDATLAGLADQRVTVFASGFLNPAANQNGPGFALLTVLADGTAAVVTPNTVSAADAPAGDALAVRAAANPVRARSAVSFMLPEAGSVRLSLVDALGREVAVLLDGERAAGTHAASFDADRLATGVYTLRLAAGGQAATSRVTVVR